MLTSVVHVASVLLAVGSVVVAWRTHQIQAKIKQDLIRRSQEAKAKKDASIQDLALARARAALDAEIKNQAMLQLVASRVKVASVGAEVAANSIQPRNVSPLRSNAGIVINNNVMLAGVHNDER